MIGTISLDDVLKFLPALAALMTSFILFASCIIAFRAFRLQRELKRIDVVLYFQNRFNTLIYDNSDIKTSEGVLAFFEKFWLIQKDQYRLWKKGFVDESTFLRWNAAIKRDFRQHRNYGNISPEVQISFLEGWEKSKPAMQDKKFVDFIDVLQSYSPQQSIKAVNSNRIMNRLLRNS